MQVEVCYGGFRNEPALSSDAHHNPPIPPPQRLTETQKNLESDHRKSFRVTEGATEYWYIHKKNINNLLSNHLRLSLSLFRGWPGGGGYHNTILVYFKGWPACRVNHASSSTLPTLPFPTLSDRPLASSSKLPECEWCTVTWNSRVRWIPPSGIGSSPPLPPPAPGIPEKDARIRDSVKVRSATSRSFLVSLRWLWCGSCDLWWAWICWWWWCGSVLLCGLGW